jgi:uridine kinase
MNTLIYGNIGSGKSTLAEILIREYKLVKQNTILYDDYETMRIYNSENEYRENFYKQLQYLSKLKGQLDKHVIIVVRYIDLLNGYNIKHCFDYCYQTLKRDGNFVDVFDVLDNKRFRFILED